MYRVMFQNSYFLATIAILFWASAPTAFKLSLEYLTPFELLIGSSFITTIILGSIVLAKNGFKHLLLIEKKTAILMFCMGVINPALYYLTSLKSYQILSAQQAQPITYSWGLMLVFMSAFLYKERLTKMDILASFICYGGVFVVASRGGDVGNINFFGVALALLAAFLWAFYWLVCARIKTEPLVVLFLNFFGGFVFLLTMLPFFYEPKVYAWQEIGRAHV